MNFSEDSRAPGDPRIAFFDRMAATWDTDEQSPAETVRRLEELADLLSITAGRDLLEVGCGTGQITRWLADRARPGRVTAIDFSAAMIERAAGKGIDATFRVADACSNDLGREAFDVVLCFHSFPHFRDQAAALRNFAQALAPGGRLIVMHLAGSDHINHFHAGIDGPVQRDLLPVGDQWQPLLSQAVLKQTRLIDRQDLFFLEATHDGC